MVEDCNDRFIYFCKDEEEFPDLFLSLTVSDRIMPSSNAAKLCYEVPQSCSSSRAHFYVFILLYTKYCWQEV